jgi:hypothetical protein
MWNLKLFGLATIVTLTLAAGSAWYGYSSGRQSGMSQIRSEWALESAQIAAAQAEQVMKARQTEQALQKAVNRIKQEKTREAIKLANDYAVVVDSLHHRPERPSAGGVPEGSAAGAESAATCTGAQLYRDDGAFLAREAHRADQLRLALKACQAAYDSVRENVNGRGQD